MKFILAGVGIFLSSIELIGGKKVISLAKKVVENYRKQCKLSWMCFHNRDKKIDSESKDLNFIDLMAEESTLIENLKEAMADDLRYFGRARPLSALKIRIRG